MPTTHHLVDRIPSSDADVAALAATMPERWLNAYDSVDTTVAPARTPVAAIERLAEVAGVVRLLHLELVPGLRSPIRTAVHEAHELFTATESLVEYSAVLYVSSAQSGAPAHIDRHPNLFVQLRGTKRFSVARFATSEIQQDAIAYEFGGKGGSALPNPEVDLTVFSLAPGDALYIPPYTFHWVESDEKTVSAACSWSTPGSNEREAVYRMNAGLRRLGLHPAPPGVHRRIDGMKAALHRIRRRTSR